VFQIVNRDKDFDVSGDISQGSNCRDGAVIQADCDDYRRRTVDTGPYQSVAVGRRTVTRQQSATGSCLEGSSIGIDHHNVAGPSPLRKHRVNSSSTPGAEPDNDNVVAQPSTPPLKRGRFIHIRG
jgi:hypothetical protein